MLRVPFFRIKVRNSAGAQGWINSVDDSGAVLHEILAPQTLANPSITESDVETSSNPLQHEIEIYQADDGPVRTPVRATVSSVIDVV